ncbi:MAG: hypothetical protein F6K24_03665, partial [Okeania sp. SIO2D1]|nr:hypothetical protein [Okeania sp. SIO2D1]
LEIRKHRVQLTLDSITEEKYTDGITLTTLADSQKEFPPKLKQLEQKEHEEALLLKEKLKLVQEIALLCLGDAQIQAAITAKREEISAQQTIIANLATQKDQCWNTYQNEYHNKLNYWCKLVCKEDKSKIARINSETKELLHGSTGADGNPYYANNKFKFVETSDGYYWIVSGGAKDLHDTALYNKDRMVYARKPYYKTSEWKLEDLKNGYYFIRHWGGEKVLDRGGTEFGVCICRKHGGANQQWKITKIGGVTNNKSQNAWSAYQRKETEWKQAKQILVSLQEELRLLQLQSSEKTSTKAQLEARKSEVIDQLTAVQNLLNSLNNDILRAINSIQKTAQTMPEVAQDDNELVAKGALLGFAPAASRVTAIETCEGNVQLSYFDNQGRMRLTNYDATADVRNRTFEEWMPDELPVGLNLPNASSQIQLQKAIYLPDEWTIETWFCTPQIEGSVSYQISEEKITEANLQDTGLNYMTIAVSGNLAVVGVPEKEGNNKEGAVEIFERNSSSGTWTKKPTLPTEWESPVYPILYRGTREYKNFGCSVAISDNCIFVGDDNYSGVGAVFIFERNRSGNWEETQVLKSSEIYSTKFGSSLAVSGDFAIVAAPSAKKAYIFERRSGSWKETKKLEDAEIIEWVLASVAISGNFAIVGTFHENADEGAAYIFERNEYGNWKKAQRLQASDGKAKNYFGQFVGISGDFAVVAAQFKNSSQGGVYIFERNEYGHWEETSQLEIEKRQEDCFFGSSVDISGNLAIVGAKMHQNNGAAVYIFKRGSGGWKLIDRKETATDIKKNVDSIVTVISGDDFGVSTRQDENGVASMFSYTFSSTSSSLATTLKTLNGSQETNNSPVAINNSKLGIKVDGQFYDSGYNIEQLSPGWHHLTAVGKGTTTIFYIDGQKVADVLEAVVAAETNADRKEQLQKENFKFTSSISTIGNFGKISSLRIWKIALSEEEIAINSKIRLTGNEPGLAAYYPLNEATGSEVRDRTGSGNNGTIYGASWWGCAAPIGNLGHQVMEFDGEDDYIEVPAHTNPTNAITVSLWARSNTEKWNAHGCLASKRQAYIWHPHQDEKKISFYVFVVSNEVQVKQLQSEEVSDIQQWHHYAATFDGTTAKIYIDGVEVNSSNISGTIQSDSDSLFIGKDDYNEARFFNGQIAEVRIWDKARTAEEIKADMHKRLTGKEENLVAYFPLNEIIPEDSTVKVLDLSGNNHHGTVHGAIIKHDNILPIGGDSLVSTEYSTISLEAITNRKIAIMRRLFAAPSLNGAEILPDQRVEELELKWIGNAQFAPTILGYIEGAPPVPSENLTVEEDYNGATSVELTMSEEMEFSWNRTQESGLGGSIDAFIGTSGQASAGIGFMSRLGEWKAGFKGNLDLGFLWQNESSIASSASVIMADYLELRGNQEVEAKFPHLGKRFIPKNVGYALVVSSLADVFITRLKRSGIMIGYQVRPVDGIPPDINTITFLINPAYTMSGSLDGLTGSEATSDRFYRHVPEMRAQYGSLYPASYYRLQEAYDLKQQIDNEDKRRESYFAQFDTTLVDETSLDRQIDSGDGPQTVGVTREVDEDDQDMTEEQKKEAEEKQKQQFKAEAGEGAKEQSKKAKEKQKEIDAKIKDQEKRAHATSSFAGWQKRMEDIQIRAGKRNIVNNYVWDGDGGLRTEAQSFANVVEHTVGGSFSLDAGLGFQGEFEAATAAGELTALVTINLTQTMSKTENRSKGLELNIDLSGVESKGITDHKDYPIQPGEKVDRYRFMSFFLEATTKNFNDFFDYVVDPEWLASNDEEARALRQAKGKANKTWRVLHRVTYVERPALMGFGRDVRQKPGEDEITQEITEYFDSLEETNKEFKEELTSLRGEIVELKSLLEKQQKSGN